MDILASILIGVGGLIVLANYGCMAASLLRRRNVSPLPFIGGLLLFSGFLKIDSLRPFAWVGLMVDHTIMTFFLVVPRLIREAGTCAVRNLLHEFRGRLDSGEYRLRLFRHGEAKLNFEVALRIFAISNRMVPCAGCRMGKWKTDGPGYAIELDHPSEIIVLHELEGMWSVEGTVELVGVAMTLSAATKV